MHLSKLLLNPRSRQARRDAGSPYELHRTLARAFVTPEGTDYRAHHGVLFRLEPLSPGSRSHVVLVQSEGAPDWHELPEEYMLEANVRPYELSPVTGQSFAFRLVANPTRKVKRPGQRQGRRVGLDDAPTEGGSSPVLDWLHRKGDQHGFAVPFAVVNPFVLGSDALPATDKRGLPLWGARFDGLLRITDAGRFGEALRSGIGPAKAFGFGLLSLARHS